MSQALKDLDIRYEEFKTIVNEKEKFGRMKEKIRSIKSNDELSESIYDLTDNYFKLIIDIMMEIKSKFNTNNLTEQQIRKYKRHGPELIKDEKFVYTHEDIITPIIMHCRVSTPKTIEVDGKGHKDRNFDHETKRQKLIKNNLVVNLKL